MVTSPNVATFNYPVRYKGVRHNPVAKDECHILLIERKTTQHTGDVKTEKTRSLEEQMRPV